MDEVTCFAGLFALPLPIEGARLVRPLGSPENREEESPSQEQIRVRRLEARLNYNGEKRHTSTRNHSRIKRHSIIVEFINTLTRAQALETHELAERLGFHYTTVVNDLREIRRTNKVQFSVPTMTGIGRIYWGKP